jgi:TRAP-type mannitol/chloroaromatic compound transport system substrate-binding protein
LEITFNKPRWERLSSEHQAIITSASEEMTGSMVQEFRYKNAQALQEIKQEGRVEIKSFPKEMMKQAKIALNEVLELEAEKSEDFRRVLANYREFVKLNTPWNDISTKHILDIRG